MQQITKIPQRIATYKHAKAAKKNQEKTTRQATISAPHKHAM